MRYVNVFRVLTVVVSLVVVGCGSSPNSANSSGGNAAASGRRSMLAPNSRLFGHNPIRASKTWLRKTAARIDGHRCGHTKSATTERYAHLAADPLRAASEAIGERIAKLMGSASRAD